MSRVKTSIKFDSLNEVLTIRVIRKDFVLSLWILKTLFVVKFSRCNGYLQSMKLHE